MIFEVCLKFEIVRRQFAKVDNKWIEAEDPQQRGVTAERTWSSFRVRVCLGPTWSRDLSRRRSVSRRFGPQGKARAEGLSAKRRKEIAKRLPLSGGDRSVNNFT